MSGKKVVIVGAGPVGSLAALYASSRGYEVEVYDLRAGMLQPHPSPTFRPSQCPALGLVTDDSIT